jgi:regulator of replication initiation timing
MDDLKSEVTALSNDVTKLRMEFANIKTTLTENELLRNGFTKNGTVKKSRVTINV